MNRSGFDAGFWRVLWRIVISRTRAENPADVREKAVVMVFDTSDSRLAGVFAKEV